MIDFWFSVKFFNIPLECTRRVFVVGRWRGLRGWTPLPNSSWLCAVWRSIIHKISNIYNSFVVISTKKKNRRIKCFNYFIYQHCKFSTIHICTVAFVINRLSLNLPCYHSTCLQLFSSLIPSFGRGVRLK